MDAVRSLVNDLLGRGNGLKNVKLLVVGVTGCGRRTYLSKIQKVGLGPVVSSTAGSAPITVDRTSSPGGGISVMEA